MKPSNNNNFTIIIDSREQKPYTFPCQTITKALAAGDYSIAGLESQIAIERKSKTDAYGTIGQGRDRFIRELEKLSRYDYAALVIESSFAEFLRPPRFSRLHPSSAINSALAWTIKYNVHVFWCDTRILAQTCVFRLLEKYYKYNNGGTDTNVGRSRTRTTGKAKTATGKQKK